MVRPSRSRQLPDALAHCVAYAWGKYRLGLDVQNLFDKGYDLPLGGMSLGDYKATGDLRPVPGRGRSFNIGLTAKF